MPRVCVSSLIQGMNFSGSTSPVDARGDRLHLLVVIMLQAAMRMHVTLVVMLMVMAVMIIMAVIVMVAFSIVEEGRLDLENPLEVEGVAAEHGIERDRAFLRAVQLGIGVDGPGCAPRPHRARPS